MLWGLLSAMNILLSRNELDVNTKLIYGLHLIIKIYGKIMTVIIINCNGDSISIK
jgi:hypothetical protein